MKKSKLPKTDSVRKLAEWWDTHDLTDFEDALEEVREPVFAARPAIRVPLDQDETEAIDRIAQAKGISREALLQSWVRQRIARPAAVHRAKRPA